MALRIPENPIKAAARAAQRATVTVNPDEIAAPTSFAKRQRDHRRQLRHLFRKETAAEAIADFSAELDVFGLTKGQFSLIQLIDAVLDITGAPADVTLSTWTAATADVEDVLAFIRAGRVARARFVLDFTFQRRQPEVAQAIRKQFGGDSLRLTRNHAKFFQISAREWTVTCKTSMNLNQNPRLEDFDLSNDPELYRFLARVVDDLFAKTTTEAQAKASTNELQHEFYGWGER